MTMAEVRPKTVSNRKTFSAAVFALNHQASKCANARYDRACERRNALNALEQIRVSNRTLNTSSRRRTCRRVKRV